MGKAHACEQKPRQCFASGNHDPVDKVAIQEGNLLMRLLAAAVDAANLLSASCHPEEQPLDMRTGLAEASKNQALVGKGVQVSLQGAALRCRCPVVGNINGVELGLGDPTECLGPSLNGPIYIDSGVENSSLYIYIITSSAQDNRLYVHRHRYT